MNRLRGCQHFMSKIRFVTEGLQLQSLSIGCHCIDDYLTTSLDQQWLCVSDQTENTSTQNNQ